MMYNHMKLGIRMVLEILVQHFFDAGQVGALDEYVKKRM